MADTSLAAAFNPGRTQPDLLPVNVGTGGFGPDEQSYIEGLAASFASGATSEFIGGDPWDSAAAFRTENPIAGLVSAFAGFAVPGIGLALATEGLGVPALISRLPAVGKGYQALRFGRLAQKSEAWRRLGVYATSAAAEESIRTGLATVLPGGDPKQVLEEAVINVPLAGAFGGVVGKFAGAQVNAKPVLGEARVWQLSRGKYDIAAPAQTRLQQLFNLRVAERAKETPNQEMLDVIEKAVYGAPTGRANQRAYGLLDYVLKQEPTKGTNAYVRKLEQNANSRFINELFVPTRKEKLKGFLVRKFIKGEGGFSGREEARRVNALKRLGWTEEDFAHMQFLRHIEVRPYKQETAAAAGKKIGSAIAGMQQITRDAWWAKEADGLYVVVRRITPDGPTLEKGQEIFLHGTTRAKARRILRTGKIRAAKPGTYEAMATRNFTYGEFGPEAVYGARPGTIWFSKDAGKARIVGTNEAQVGFTLKPKAKVRVIETMKDLNALAKEAGYDNWNQVYRLISSDLHDAGPGEIADKALREMLNVAKDTGRALRKVADVIDIRELKGRGSRKYGAPAPNQLVVLNNKAIDRVFPHTEPADLARPGIKPPARVKGIASTGIGERIRKFVTKEKYSPRTFLWKINTEEYNNFGSETARVMFEGHYGDDVVALYNDTTGLNKVKSGLVAVVRRKQLKNGKVAFEAERLTSDFVQGGPPGTGDLYGPTLGRAIDTKLTSNVKIGTFNTPEKAMQAIERRAENLHLLELTGGQRASFRNTNPFIKLATEPAGEEYVIFKTDNIGRFFPEKEDWAIDQIKRLWPDALETTGDDVLQESTYLGRRMALHDQTLKEPAGPVLSAAYRAKGATEKILETIPEAQQKAIGKFFGSYGAQSKKVFAPILHLFSDFPPAVAMMARARAIFADAEAISIRRFAGSKSLGDIKSPLGAIFPRGSAAKPGGIKGLIRQLTQDDIDDLTNRLAIEGLQGRGTEELLQAGYSPRLVNFVKEVFLMDGLITKEMTDINKLVGVEDFVPNADHLMLSRAWIGDYRVPILNDKNVVIGYGSGYDGAMASREADALIEEAKKVGEIWTKGDGFLTGREDMSNLLKEMKIASGRYSDSVVTYRQLLADLRSQTPLKFRERHKAVGFKKKYTTRELEERIFANVVVNHRNMAEKLARYSLRSELPWLGRVRPDMAAEMNDRIARMGGQTGPLTKVINKYADNVLGPFLGRDSASKLSSGINKVNYMLTLGFFDLGFPALNAVTFLHTVLPEVAMVTSGTSSRLQHYYAHTLVAQAGKARPVSFLDPLKITGRAIKELKKPQADTIRWVRRAIQDGTINPRFAEEFLGDLEHGASLTRLVKGEATFSEWLTSMSSILPAKSEELARTHAFITGKILAQDFMQLTDEAAYRFANEFTNRTMYLYSQPMRAKMMMGPVGNLFGLFKNWTFHYMGQMGNYMNAGFVDNNWRPMLWSMMGAGSVAGITGTPLYFAIDGMSKFFSDESLQDNVLTWSGYKDAGFLQEKATDMLFHGLPAFLGLSFMARGEAPTADPIRDVSSLSSIASFDRFGKIGSALYEGLNTYRHTGRHPSHNSLFWDKVIRAVAPRTAYRGWQSMWSDGIRALSTGNQLISDITIPERVAFSFGFTPVEVQQYYDLGSELYEKKERLDGRIAQYGELMAQAYREEDYDQIASLARQAVVVGVPIDRVVSSMRRRYSNDMGDSVDRQVDEYTAWEKKRRWGFDR